MRVGDRSKKTCQRLWEAIPQEYRQGHCLMDFLRVYAFVIPEEQHSAVGKETGETAHVERWNNTLRQRLVRFVRMPLSFSKSEVMHEACLLLFLHRYTTERAIRSSEPLPPKFTPYHTRSIAVRPLRKNCHEMKRHEETHAASAAL